VITFAGYTWRNRLMQGEWREIDVLSRSQVPAAAGVRAALA
jgi:hypothetical protein